MPAICRSLPSTFAHLLLAFYFLFFLSHSFFVSSSDIPFIPILKEYKKWKNKLDSKQTGKIYRVKWKKFSIYFYFLLFKFRLLYSFLFQSISCWICLMFAYWIKWISWESVAWKYHHRMHHKTNYVNFEAKKRRWLWGRCWKYLLLQSERICIWYSDMSKKLKIITIMLSCFLINYTNCEVAVNNFDDYWFCWNILKRRFSL